MYARIQSLDQVAAMLRERRQRPVCTNCKRSIMMTDRYELPLSSASSAARDAYVEGCEAKLTTYPGALEGFDRAIAADPGFALANAARAHVPLEHGMPQRRARRWRRPIPLPPVCPRGKPAISHFSTCFRRATPKPHFPHCPRT
jgi:hypothetical protein